MVFVVGVAFVAVLLATAILVPNPTPFQYTFFRIILALFAAAVAALIPGSLGVEVSKAVRAGGAIAVFVIVYFFTPAGLVVTPPPDSVTVTFPEGLTLRAAIISVAETDNTSAKFLPSCRQSYLQTMVRGGQITAKNRVEIIEQLQYRLIDPQSNASLKVSHPAGGGIYEIGCSK